MPARCMLRAYDYTVLSKFSHLGIQNQLVSISMLSLPFLRKGTFKEDEIMYKVAGK